MVSNYDGFDIDKIIKKLLTTEPRNIEMDGGLLVSEATNCVLTKNQIFFLCASARDVFLGQPSLLDIKAPVTIVGDIHGQYTDLKQFFHIGDLPSNNNPYLFLGDYVDRGPASIETICLLLAYKIKYPEHFHLLRGNHEDADVTRVYGFNDECLKKFNDAGTFLPDGTYDKVATLADTIDKNQSEVKTNATDAVFHGDGYEYIEIDKEVMRIIKQEPFPVFDNSKKEIMKEKEYTLTVERGVNDTTIASHSINVEVKYKRMCSEVWRVFCDCFNCLPFAAIVSDSIFCIHGGLSPHLQTVDQIHKIDRPTTVGSEEGGGFLCDLLWSDPLKKANWRADARGPGVGVNFGEKNCTDFLRKNNLSLICRAHQQVQDGYAFFASRKLVTVFSAPHYCGTFENDAAIMVVDPDLKCSFKILKCHWQRA